MLVPEWVPREENEQADYYSKLVDEDDWMLNPELFSEIDAIWGPHSVDCFASSATAQLPRFCSRWWNPGCIEVNAFAIDWEEENLWLVPPIHLIGKVINKLLNGDMHGSLLVPLWRSAHWWPVLFPMGTCQKAVKMCLELMPQADNFTEGTCKWNLFDSLVPRHRVLIVRICTREECMCHDISPEVLERQHCRMRPWSIDMAA